MLDLKFIRENPKLVQKKALQKGCEIDIDKILDFDEKARKLQMRAEDAKAKRNHTAKEIGEQKRSGEDISSLTKGLKVHSENIAKLDNEIKDLLSKRDFMLATIPNMPADDVPIFDDPIINYKIRKLYKLLNSSFVEFKYVVDSNLDKTNLPEHWALFLFKKFVKNIPQIKSEPKTVFMDIYVWGSRILKGS